jgi:hypothetical protein
MECIVFSLSDWYVTFRIIYSEVFICQRALLIYYHLRQ